MILIRTQAADAAAEAKQLSQLGLASITVQDPESLGALRVALADLRGRDDVDPARIGVIAEGPGAALAAKLLAREPVITAAVLGNAPAEAGAPLSTLQGARVLLQRGIDTGKATEAVAQRLVTKAPVGTLLYQHPSLRDTAATRERDDWLRDELS
ncbi:MAG TPA: hypothetical protein VFT50_02435 [Baekduia sp.]|nr:hypothetical protein [Baekduia sp.]